MMRSRPARFFCGLAAIFVLAVICFGTFIAIPPTVPEIEFPEGKTFAFTIVDDTDMATLENIQPVYEFLALEGIRTTKTVWVLPGTEQDFWANRGDSLTDPAYRDFIVGLQSQGFEIASHGARGGGSERLEILAAMDQFKAELGNYPRVHVNHAANRENVYWGYKRLTFPPYRWLYKFVASGPYEGESGDSSAFWGDFVRENISYVVDFSFFEINLWGLNPRTPYYVPEKPLVGAWFNTSDGGTLASFNALLESDNLDRLEREGGVCIVYTHLGKGFFQDGELDPTFVQRIRDLSSRSGWFVPASVLLDHLKAQQRESLRLPWRERVRLETLWLIDKLVHGSS